MNDSHSTDRELAAWQADRYLLDELTAAEQAEFSELLSNDQASREMLAEEVLLLGSLAQLEAADYSACDPVRLAQSSTRTADSRQQRGWSTWLASGIVAASLLGAALLASQSGFLTSRSAGDSLARRSGQVEELASLWSSHFDVSEAVTLESLATETELDTRAVLYDDNSEMAPDWMFAAVAAEADTDTAPMQESIQ